MTTIAFFGSHPLGERCLEYLHNHSDVTVSVVVTYPEDASNWWNGSVHDLATDLGYPVLSLAEEDKVSDYPVDYLLSVYYPNILGPDILNHPREAAVNLHQAELPRYRGSNVFSLSIMNAREDDYWQHGTTMHVMAETVDAGDILARNFVDITETDTAQSLYEKTRDASMALFKETLPALIADDIDEMRTPQETFDGPRYFYAKDSLDGMKEIPREMVADPAEERALYDRIRALDFPPFEPAYTYLGDQKVYLTKSGYGK
jgi:methionyl-tRNA formyltransferase